MINSSIDSKSNGFDSYYNEPRVRLLNLLDIEPTSVLEIGCGGGATLNEVKLRWPRCQTAGVELRPEAAALATEQYGLDNIFVGDVMDRAVADFRPGQFDVLIFCHVLEHFPDPEAVLQRALGWLSESGRVLVAVPNVRHATVLMDLLWRGDFQYRDSGIMDRTHLRFFTRLSAERLMRTYGLNIDRVDAHILGPKSTFLSRVSLGRADGIAAFAYNFLASRAGRL